MKELAGMVLAAGFGERLLPATRYTPKPLMGFFGVPLLYVALRQLEDVGLSKIIVNAHYLKEQIIDAAQAWPGISECVVSAEEKILGTGGAFSKVHEHRSGHDLLVVNGDLVHLYNLNQFVDHYQSSNAVALMALRPTLFPGEAAIWCVGKKVVHIGATSPRRDASPYGYACIQILSDKFLNRIKDEKECSVIDYYKDALNRGDLVEGHVQEAFWFDTGSPQTYWKAHCAYLDLQVTLRDHPGFDPLKLNLIREQSGRGLIRWFLKDSTLFSGSKIIGPSAIEEAASFEHDAATGPYVVMLGPVNIAKGIQVRHSLIHRTEEFTLSRSSENLWLNDAFLADQTPP